MNKKNLSESLNRSCHDLVEWVSQQENSRFVQGPEGKWDTSQHIDHLMKTTKALTKGLKIPKFLLKYRFGTPNRDLRKYDLIVEKYQSKLKSIPAGVVAPFTSISHPVSNKEIVLKTFSDDNGTLIKTLNKWSEKQLDNYLLPHPLMGRMIVREILMWTHYHHYHHLNILKEKY